MEITNLDTIEFFNDSKRHIRVYYQTKDNFIRESAFESDSGWFVPSSGIIATNAKEKTPITATRWNSDNATHIRIYFLNTDTRICECIGMHRSGKTVWQPNPSPLQINKEIKVIIGSQLAVARPDRDEETLRVFYQAPPEKEKDKGKFPVREVKYRKNLGRWMLQDAKIDEAIENTRLTAISAGKTGNVRLYYQDKDYQLRESFWNSEPRQWNQSVIINEDFVLLPHAPISAVCWYNEGTADIEDLRIRVYSILKTKPVTIVELACNGQDWDDPADIISFESGEAAKTSSLAVSRNNTSDPSNPIGIFYQPRPKIIDLVLADNDTMAKAVKDEMKPRGIPISR